MLKLFVVLMFLMVPRTVESADGCRISPLPNGWIQNAIPPFARLAVDDYVNSYTSVTYKCNNNYLLDGPASNMCLLEKWANVAPKCICTRQFNETTRAASCTDNGIEEPTREDYVIQCGKVTQNVTKTPWEVDVVIHNVGKFFGTIINTRFVISIAYLFIDGTVNELHDLSIFRVDIVRQNFLHQQLKVERVVFPPNFGKHLKVPQSGNIAVVGLQTRIHFTSYVVPLCLPFGLPVDSLTRSSFKGRTSELDNIELYLPKNCYQELNSGEKPQISIETLCTSHLKLTECPMNTGTSFAIPMEKGGSEAYYLVGMETYYKKHNEGIYLTFQNVLFYKDFIQNEIQGKSAPVPAEECSTTCGMVQRNEKNTPWNVRVCHQQTKACLLGTIISARLVLTVATHFLDKQKPYDFSDIYVDISIAEIIHQQIEAERIAYAPIPNEFSIKPPSSNIVVIHLRNSISFNPSISPICVSFELSAANVIGNSLKGRTLEQDNIELHLPGYCSSEIFYSVLAPDVYCTSRLKLDHTDLTVGSSFAVPITKQGSEAFYLVGLYTWAMTSPYSETSFVFENVMFFQDFIRNEMSDDWEKRCKASFPAISDETPYATDDGIETPTRGDSVIKCRANSIPDRGDAYYEKNNQKIEFGEIIENSVQIIYRCIENHVLFGSSTNICLDGKWIIPTPECKPRCSPNEIQGWTLIANCQFQEGNVTRVTSCTEPASPGTVAVLSCQRGYERFSSIQQTSTCGTNGRWSPLPDKCTPVCGQISKGVPFIVGGEVSEITKVPWHAGIYRKNNGTEEPQQICGGSIVTAKIVISAMHCFWDPSNDKKRPNDQFLVTVGKSKRKFSAVETLKPQFFEVENVFYDEAYIDYAGHYANDIAIVVLNNFIEFRSYIAPLCVEFDLEYDDKIVQPGLFGRVAGWGLEQTNGNKSSFLKEIELPVVSRKDCTEQSTTEFRPFITSDKFCAGDLSGVGVCQGDSGGGLVIPETNRFKTVYSLRGIVSVGEHFRDSCDNSKYTLFTNVRYYSDLLKKYYFEYQPTL